MTSNIGGIPATLTRLDGASCKWVGSVESANCDPRYCWSYAPIKMTLNNRMNWFEICGSILISQLPRFHPSNVSSLLSGSSSVCRLSIERRTTVEANLVPRVVKKKSQKSKYFIPNSACWWLSIKADSPRLLGKIRLNPWCPIPGAEARPLSMPHCGGAEVALVHQRWTP